MRVACLHGLVLLAILGAAAGCATSGGPQGVLEFGSVRYEGTFTGAPRVVEQPRYTYPPQLLAARVEGTVELRYRVESDGRVSDVEVLHASDPAFAEAAVRTARSLHYHPAVKGMLPVACVIEITFIFELE